MDILLECMMFSDHLRAVLRDLSSKFDMWMVSATESLPDGARDALVRIQSRFLLIIKFWPQD